MKKTALKISIVFATCIIGICIFAAVILNLHLFNTDKAALLSTTSTSMQTPPAIKTASQNDTNIDVDSNRDTFEYFLSGLGEKDIDTLKKNFTAFNEQQNRTVKIDEALFQQYIDYKAALFTLERTTSNGEISVNSQLLATHQQLLAIQRQFFTPEQQQALFGEENQLRELALKQQELKHQAQSPADYQQLWQDELDQLPPNLQESYRNASLLNRLALTKNMDAQSQFLIRGELVGSEATMRLTNLDQQRGNFKQQVDKYLVEREKILLNEHNSQDNKLFAIQTLRELSFESSQYRRIQALENIHDQQVAQ
ncbi:MAG: lipase secretion chaperone [Photobacterium frigidiphilum]|uniref:lipase secretion chaperone n=1 Tax=Photobacterium frigidiphilum TaxID=264736 RepID=UPI003001ED4A